jgi:hypothetical protein
MLFALSCSSFGENIPRNPIHEKGTLKMVAIPHPKVAFGELAEKMKGRDAVIGVPREMLARLVDLYISCWDFDEQWYLETYPDVQDAINRGMFPSGWAHFRGDGYFEGRLGAEPVVDTEWYTSTYPDIAQAMLDGKITSALDHFVKFGYAEGRLPQDPRVHPVWYAPRYIPAENGAVRDEVTCTAHFVRTGYRQLAIPAPPR